MSHNWAPWVGPRRANQGQWFNCSTDQLVPKLSHRQETSLSAVCFPIPCLGYKITILLHQVSSRRTWRLELKHILTMHGDVRAADYLQRYAPFVQGITMPEYIHTYYLLKSERRARIQPLPPRCVLKMMDRRAVDTTHRI